MSTATLAPEQLTPAQPPAHIPSAAQQRPAGHLYFQSICVFALLVTDLLTIALSLRLAIFMRAELLPRFDSNVQSLVFSFRHYLEFSWIWLLLVVLLAIEGLYTQRRTLWNEIAHLTKATVLGLIVIFAAIALVQQSAQLSRATVLITALLLLVSLPTSRYWTKRVLGAAGLWKKRILIIGTTDTAQLAMRGLSSDPVLGYEVVGMLDEDPGRRGACVAVCGKKKFLFSVKSATLSNISNEPMQKTCSSPFLILRKVNCSDLFTNCRSAAKAFTWFPSSGACPMMNLRVDGFLRERLMMLKLSNNLAKPWNSWLKRILIWRLA